MSGKASEADVIIISICIITGGLSLTSVAPSAKAITAALAAAPKIFSTIARKSPMHDDGRKLPVFEGSIELHNIKHAYPSRPEMIVVDALSLKIPAGKMTAIVGASGSGKSTIIGLIERFYDPIGGEVLVDGVDIRCLDTKWLRRHVSLVQQESVLFSMSVEDNIRHGLSEHGNRNDEATKALVVDAAKMANAHDFIIGLPQGYDTPVGERGFLLSGGQKQRIAIARAVVGNPKILLLDEATSALDTNSELIVQRAIDQSAQNRTTVIVAHRLSTIKAADNIIVLSQGHIVEQGKHSELLDKKGTYYELVRAQDINTASIKRGYISPDDEAFVGEEKLGLRTISTPKPQKPGEEFAEKQLLSTETERSSSLSPSTSAIEERNLDRAEQYPLWMLIKLVAQFNRQDWPIMAVGIVCSIIAGGCTTIQALLCTKSLVALSLPPSMYGKLRSDINFWCWMYLMVAFVELLSVTGQGAILGWCSENLIRRARDRAFRAMLRQDIKFFDFHSAGSLTTFLSTETMHLAGLSGATLGTFVMIGTTLTASITLSIAVGWKIGLVCTSTLPIFLACGFLRLWMLGQFQERAARTHEIAASGACEAAGAIRTVASLTLEEEVWQRYHDQLAAKERLNLLSILKSSTLYAASQSLIFLCNALGFWYGGTRILAGEYTDEQFLLCFLSIVFGAEAAGTFFAFAPDMTKTRNAAARLQALFQHRPKIDSSSQEGHGIETVGSIEMRDVYFRYPRRPEQHVLRGLSFLAQPDQYVALVGASGCGKSTVISLLERFYDVDSGGVYVDGKDIRQLNIMDYRRHFALVGQEPTLYQGTIRENVLLGVDGEQSVSDATIEKVCREANIWEFICSLP